MRLVCPNCDAEYEVDAAAIPLTGRDVQCSNCGHAWFQTHPEMEAAEEAEADAAAADLGRTQGRRAEAAAAASDGPQSGGAEAGGPQSGGPQSGEAEADGAQSDGAEAAAEMGFAAEAEDVTPDLALPEVVTPVTEERVAAVAAPSRSLDETVLAVLREEAERETAARRVDAAVAAARAPRQPVIETQTEMPLVPEPSGVAAAVRRIARLRGVEPEPVAPPPPPKSRRDMLPAIEEINSTLRATSDRTSDADAAIVDSLDGGAAGRSGFRRGFLILVTLAVIIVVLYVFAPVLGAKVPALAGIAAKYVQVVDAARLWLDAQLRALIEALRQLAGGQGG